eukprot:5654593-Pleurochrysis_carterae.AAC.1
MERVWEGKAGKLAMDKRERERDGKSESRDRGRIWSEEESVAPAVLAPSSSSYLPSSMPPLPFADP